MAKPIRVRAGFCSFAFPLAGRDRAIQNQAGQQMLAQSGVDQMKELLAQVKAELANSADNDPEIMRLLDEQMKAAEVAQADPLRLMRKRAAAHRHFPLAGRGTEDDKASIRRGAHEAPSK